MKKIGCTWIVALLGLATANAALIGEYTFNDTGAGTVADRMPVAMGATSPTAGASLSILGTNTTTTFEFGGFNNLPPANGFDGMGFGGNSGDSLLWIKRADLGVPSSFNQTDTSAAVQPLSFTVTADAVSSITITDIVIDTGAGGAATIFALQEAGAARGPTVTYGANALGTVNLASPVLITPGSSKTFTIYMNTGNFGSTTWFDNIAVNGSVIPEPATLGLFGLVSLGAFVLRRFRM